jgi:hypothetical protein
MNLENDGVRLAIKRVVALARWCESYERPFPEYPAVAKAIGKPKSWVGACVNLLINEGILMRPYPHRYPRILKVNC